MFATCFADVKELEAHFRNLESLRKEAIKEFEEVFFFELEGKRDAITLLSLSSDLQKRVHADSLYEAYSLLHDTYWVFRKSVKELVEEFLFMERDNYRFFKGEWYKAALRIEELEKEMDKVFGLILSEYKREIRKELRRVNLEFRFKPSSISLKRRKRNLEIELNHPSLTKEKLLA